ncbi:MAG: hypothetical protein EU550_03640 [Promethearchaeota archaeon]|nr:MAG: hypothetical protein EU550_03640 [Candidatus Lokiarchaeota archaeon]
MEKAEILTLSRLFDALGIVEKGIEKIYHYLLMNKRINNLQKVTDQYDLSLKRGYKICSVLSELDLVHIYDRPMKIYIHTDVIKRWQVLINERIQELKDQFEKSKEECGVAFDEFIKNYDLKEESTEESSPVEFINYNIEDLEDLYYPFLAKNLCKIATGIRYENPLVKFIQNQSEHELENNLKTLFSEHLNNIRNNILNIKIEVIFNSEILNQLLETKEFDIIKSLVKQIGFKVKNIEIRVTDVDFSNFSLTDDELIQPSFDPSNKLLGAYVSRNQNIYQIFFEKFNELFVKAISVDEFVQENKKIKIDELSDIEKFTLCLL